MLRIGCDAWRTRCPRMRHRLPGFGTSRNGTARWERVTTLWGEAQRAGSGRADMGQGQEWGVPRTPWRWRGFRKRGGSKERASNQSAPYRNPAARHFLPSHAGAPLLDMSRWTCPIIGHHGGPRPPVPFLDMSIGHPSWNGTFGACAKRGMAWHGNGSMASIRQE